MIKLIKRNLSGFGISLLLSVLTLVLHAIMDLYLPTINANLTNNGMARGDIPYIIRMGAWMMLAVLISTVAMICSSYFSSKTAMGLGKNMREEFFRHVQSLSKGDVDKVGTASLITRGTNDVQQVTNAAIMMLRMMLMSPTMFVGGIVMAWQKCPELAWIILCALPPIILLMIYMLKKGMPLFKSIQKKVDTVNQVVREYLSGIRVIRAFCKDDYETKRFDLANLDLQQVSLKVARMLAFMMPALMLIINATTIAIVWIGGHEMQNGTVEVGDLTAFITYVSMILFSLMLMSMMFIVLPRASASADRINEVLAMRSDVADPDAATDIRSLRGGYVTFDDVSFSYPGADMAVLEHISFSAKPGEVVAIIGGTGCGKSTLINLIPRFYDTTGGSVLLDGTDVRSLKQDELRARIGLVPQKSFLFTGTIADNVRFGKQDATDEEVIDALKIAQAYDFVMEMEEGIQTQITQGGTNVSGGQRQRLAIARALVRKPDIYIFDDSFSALDFKTDAALRKALFERVKDATIFIVAQRVSTIMNADKIIVLNDGVIAGCGRHAELMKTCDVYREIVCSQHAESEVG
ncbi:MAG: ABC transporter ATP-binding protein [Lachnospiraceae bacterium]|nr:ABC transporter ATP-binding protein [Parasporobacterium sp.]MBR4168477.1 ABC transporter ATP-binding protein [Lachnospiraceae bacterium]MCR4685398.1 ABC transporter ATP-binding protein/permease [Lachnospiraceae bacterium]